MNTEERDECCGTCKYHRYDRNEQEWICNCQRSDNYADYTEYSDYCENWEDRR